MIVKMFLIGPFPASFSFRLFNTKYVVQYNCRLLDSNCRTLVMGVTALPTESQTPDQMSELKVAQFLPKDAQSVSTAVLLTTSGLSK